MQLIKSSGTQVAKETISIIRQSILGGFTNYLFMTRSTERIMVRINAGRSLLPCHHYHVNVISCFSGNALPLYPEAGLSRSDIYADNIKDISTALLQRHQILKDRKMAIRAGVLRLLALRREIYMLETVLP